MSKILIVSAVSEVKEDKNGRDYKTIQLSKVEHKMVMNPLTGQKTMARGKVRVSALNAYEENYLGNEDLAWSSKKGDILLGDMVTKNVTPYDIEIDGNARTVDTCTCIVLGDTANTVEFNKETKQQFKSAAYVAKDEPLRFEIIEPTASNVELEEEFELEGE